MTHRDPELSELSSDVRLASLLGSLTDADFDRADPPADLFARIAERVTVESALWPIDHPVVVSMNKRRLGRASGWLAAAAVVALVAGVATMFAVRSPSSTEQVVATAELRQLEPLGATTASAQLVTESGRTHLVIDATDMPPAPAGSEYELWLIDRGVTDPRSLGTVTGSSDVVVPMAIDPTKYPIVDISIEPQDGNRQHSGHSIMRGDLT